MINDSDEEILYGSDTEELLDISSTPIPMKTTSRAQPLEPLKKQPLSEAENTSATAIIPNLIDTRTDEESD